MNMQVYHYRNKLEPSGWSSFSLTPEHGLRWNLFCQELGIKRPKDPNPYFSDYLSFINELKLLS